MNDWDDAFDNVGHIPNAAGYPPRWAQQAQDYRNTAHFSELDIHYGSNQRERFDLFHSNSTPKGLVVFIHGGYWLRLDKSYWSHLAEGARRNGWAVAIPSYVLAPEMRIKRITRGIAAAINTAGAMIKGPIRLAGHSAGGHLACRMMCKDNALDDDVQQRIEHVLSISGLHDLRPLLHTKMNQTLGLTEKEAFRESPCLKTPYKRISLTAWVGADERPEFIRQMKLITHSWADCGVTTEGIIDPGHHHFSVIDGLSDANSKITNDLCARRTPVQ